MKIKFFVLLVVLLAIVSGYICITQYPYVFSRKVVGEVIAIDRVTAPTTIIGGTQATPPSQIYSFAVAIRRADGEIVTASSEDRQWAVVQKGQCTEAEFFPYPPWEFSKAGTFFGARMTRLFDCPTK